MSKVYLAGPIQHVNDYGKGWRQWLKKNSDAFEWVDPMAKYNTMEEAEAEWTESDIVEDDLEMIDECDAILVHWDEVPTCGTPMEVFYTKHVSGKPVVVQTSVERDEISPWLSYHADVIVESFDDAIAALDQLIVTQ